MKKFWILSVFIAFSVSLLVSSCGKNDDNNNNQNNSNNTSGISDQELYTISNNKTGFMYYKNVTDTISAVGNNNPHKPFILVRFNDKAISALGQDGKLPAGASFPEDAVIVNEIYEKKGAPLKNTFVMMKKPKDPNSEAAWLWAEFSPSGSVLVSTVDKGSQCINCHRGQGNRDLVMTFSLH